MILLPDQRSVLHKKHLVFTFLFALAGCFLSPNPENEKPSEDNVPEEATEPESLKFEWFEGVASDGQHLHPTVLANLPEEHPCHDNTRVVGVNLDGIRDFTTYTLVERRLGARSVQGVRWIDGDREHLVVTCLIAGERFREIDANWREHNGFDPGYDVGAKNVLWPGDAVFLELSGELNHVERASISWMERKQGGEWLTTRDLVEWANCDECNEQHFVARMSLLSVSDQDQDRAPEFVWMQLQNHRSSESDDREFGFDVKVSAIENRDEETRLSHLIGPDLKLEDSTSHPIPADASDGRKLLAGLAKKGHSEAISKAKSILRDAGKLQRNKPGKSCQVRPDEAQIQERLSGTSVD